MRNRLLAAPLAILSLIQPAAAQEPTSVAISLSNFHIVPTPIHLVAGRSVRLLFTNTSGGGHDFTAPAFFASARNLVGPVERGQVELGGHATATVMLSPARGRYPVKCSHFAHKMMGMSATIIVD